MKKNESKTDRLVRIILAIVFLLIAYYSPQHTWQIIFYVVAGILTLTAITGFCPLYTVTCPANHHEKEPIVPVAKTDDEKTSSSIDSKPVDQEDNQTPVSDTINDELKSSENLSNQNVDQVKTVETSQAEVSNSKEVPSSEKDFNQSETPKQSETSNDDLSSDEEIKNS